MRTSDHGLVLLFVQVHTNEEVGSSSDYFIQASSFDFVLTQQKYIATKTGN
jgi:hypothetical protein